LAQDDLFLIFVKPLNQLAMRYMVTGAAAAVVYGQPRMTHDIDLVVMISSARAVEISRKFPQERFYCPPEEVMQLEIRRPQRGHFNIIHTESGFKADFYPAGDDPLNLWGLEHSREIILQDEAVHFAPPEYVILRKLEYFREGGSGKHIQDIRAMADALAGKLDLPFIRSTAAKMGLLGEWEGIVKRMNGGIDLVQ
jgi:hypothetical protein